MPQHYAAPLEPGQWAAALPGSLAGLPPGVLAGLVGKPGKPGHQGQAATNQAKAATKKRSKGVKIPRKPWSAADYPSDEDAANKPRGGAAVGPLPTGPTDLLFG